MHLSMDFKKLLTLMYGMEKSIWVIEGNRTTDFKKLVL